MAGHFAAFRNLVTANPGTNEAEELDHFTAGLKKNMRIEFLKTYPVDLNTASLIALNVDSTIYSASMFTSSTFVAHAQPQAMKIGNVK